MKINKAPLNHNYAEAQRDFDHRWYMKEFSAFLKEHEDKHYTPEEWLKVKKDSGIDT